MHSEITTPPSYYNVITIFTSGILLIWVVKAVWRFIYMLRIRLAVISGRIVPIRGLCNYLPILTEISSQTHINAILHTRQANPPKSIKSMYIPFTLDDAFIQDNDGISSLHLSLWTSMRCHIYILQDFDVEKFKTLLRDSPPLRTGHSSSSGSRSISTIRELLSSISNNGISYNANQFLKDSKVCSEISDSGKVNYGLNSIRLQTDIHENIDLKSSANTANSSSVVGSSEQSKRETCLIIVPEYSGDHHHHRTSTLESSPNTTSPRNSSEDAETGLISNVNPINKYHESKFYRIKKPSSTSSVSPSKGFRVKQQDNDALDMNDTTSGDIELGNMHMHIDIDTSNTSSPNPSQNTNAANGMDCPAAVLCILHKSTDPKPATAEGNPDSNANNNIHNNNKIRKFKVEITEDFIITKSNFIYSSQEIFGWRAPPLTVPLTVQVQDASTGTGTISSTVSTDTDAQGYDDDCVVCLTEKKDTTLLPCRHLCVCRGCLIHIDKCPVCRASFEEYLILSPNTGTPTSIPFHSIAQRKNI